MINNANKEHFQVCALLYDLLAQAFSFADEQAYNQLCELASKCAEVSELNEALSDLLNSDYKSFSAERNSVFYDFSLVNVPMDASFYDEGRDNGKMRIIVSGILKRANLAKATSVSDNEDSLNVVFSFASLLAQKASQDEQSCELLDELFSRVINVIADEFSLKLKQHKNSQIFASLSKVLDILLDLERERLGLQAPVKKERSAADIALSRVPYEPRVPTNFSKINMQEVTDFKGN